MKRFTRKARGGFIPSVMGGVVRLGPSLMAAGVAQGSKLLSPQRRSRRRRTRRAKRSRRRF